MKLSCHSNTLHHKKSLLLRRQILFVFFASVLVLSRVPSFEYALCFWIGGLDMTMLVVLFAHIGEVLFTQHGPEEVGIEDECRERRDQGTHQTVPPKVYAAPVRNAPSAEDVGGTPQQEGNSHKGKLLFLLPVKFMLLLVPLFIANSYGRTGLLFFSGGLLLALIPLLFPSGKRGENEE
jgi:hypothetical protein